MHPEIQQARAALFDAIRDLDPDQADAAIEGKWSIAGIVEHLCLTYSRSVAGLRRRLEKGPGVARSRTLKQQFQQFVVVRLGYFPTGRESPKLVLPQGRPYRDLVAELDRQFVDLDACLTEAGRALGASSAVLDHPVLGPFSVNQWRKFHLVHTRHHAKQIRQRRRT